MRSRFVHASFFSDAKVSRLTLPARLFFVATWLLADDFGNFDSDPEDIALFAFPRDTGIDGTSLMTELIASKLIIPYGGRYYHIPGILRHQDPRYLAKPRHPLCPNQGMPKAYREKKGSDAPVPPEPRPKPKPKRQRSPDMVKPTVEECRAHAVELGMPAEQGDRFEAHHRSKGWMVGAAPMKDWKAAMVTWRSNWEEFKKKKGKTSDDQPFWMK